MTFVVATCHIGGQGTLSSRISQLLRCVQFRTQVSVFQHLTNIRLLLVVAGCCGLLGIGLCAFCAHFPLAALGSLVPLAAIVSSAGTATRNAADDTSAGPGAASYARFSSDLQDERSITDQQRKCRERAKKDGLAIRPELEFSDEAVSGAKHSREGFDAMRAAAHAGHISVLYVESLSRMARDLILTLTTFRVLVDELGIRIVAIDDGVDTTQSINWDLIVMLCGWQNQQYLRHLSQQVHRGQEGLVLDRLSVGDYCFGFTARPVSETRERSNGKDQKLKKKYAIDETEARYVRLIFSWFVHERRSLRWIAKELNRRGASKDHRATTEKWTHQLVTSLLKNPKYVGRWPWGLRKNVRRQGGRITQEFRSAVETEKWVREFPELRIISDELFAKAQAILKCNAETHRHRRGEKKRFTGSTPESAKAYPRHLLSGLIECGHCGRTLRVGGPNGRYLFCPGYHMGDCSCQTQLRRDLGERMILDAIGDRILTNPVWRKRVLDIAQQTFKQLQNAMPGELQAARKALANVERRMERLLDNAEEQRFPGLEARYAKRRAERNALRAKLERLQQEADRHTGPPTEQWLEQQLVDLQSLLHDQVPAAAHALRDLVGGKIAVNEIRLSGKQRHFLRGQLRVRLHDVTQSVGFVDSTREPDDQQELIVLDFRQPKRYEQVADDVKHLWDDGKSVKEICHTLGCSYTLVNRALDHWYGQHGLIRPDGRRCRKRLKSSRAADTFQDEIMSLWQQDLPVSEIAKRIGHSVAIVRQAVVQWHTERELSVPDGRTRRRAIRMKKASSTPA